MLIRGGGSFHIAPLLPAVIRPARGHCFPNGRGSALSINIVFDEGLPPGQ